MEPCSGSEPCSSAASSSSESSCPALEVPESSGESSPQTFYDVLGVSIQATSDAIRQAYRRLARIWHPDRHNGDKRKFQELQGAYEVLSDVSKRHQYDLNLLEFLDVEEYLSRYQGLILTASGLTMNSRQGSASSNTSSWEGCSYAGSYTDGPLDTPRQRAWHLLKAS